MNRLLFSRASGALIFYPRQDDEPVVGLDRTTYHVVEVVREPKPEYDPATHYLQPLEPVVSITDPESDDIDGSATCGWEPVELPPVVPPPRWVEFGAAVQSDPAINGLLGEVFTMRPALGLGLGVGLSKAEDGRPANFLGSWGMALALGLISPELLAAVEAMAEQFDLPADFVEALRPQ